MSKGKFDAAIHILAGERCMASKTEGEQADLWAAILVLEVAGKLNKTQCQDLLDVLIGEDIVVTKSDIGAVRQFEALLSALPEKEE